MLNFISNNLKYPESAKKQHVQGLAISKFKVDENGKITDITILQSIQPDMDNEVIRLISIMPLWTPAKEEGKNVKAMYTLPLRFGINE